MGEWKSLMRRERLWRRSIPSRVRGVAYSSMPGVTAHYGVAEAHVVGVVVRDEYAAYGAYVYAVAGQLGLDEVVVNAGINEQAALGCAYVGAVAAAARSLTT